MQQRLETCCTAALGGEVLRLEGSLLADQSGHGPLTGSHSHPSSQPSTVDEMGQLGLRAGVRRPGLSFVPQLMVGQGQPRTIKKPIAVKTGGQAQAVACHHLKGRGWWAKEGCWSSHPDGQQTSTSPELGRWTVDPITIRNNMSSAGGRGPELSNGVRHHSRLRGCPPGSTGG